MMRMHSLYIPAYCATKHEQQLKPAHPLRDLYSTSQEVASSIYVQTPFNVYSQASVILDESSGLRALASVLFNNITQVTNRVKESRYDEEKKEEE